MLCRSRLKAAQASTELPVWEGSKPRGRLAGVDTRRQAQEELGRWQGGEMAAGPDKVYHERQRGLWERPPAFNALELGSLPHEWSPAR